VRKMLALCLALFVAACSDDATLGPQASPTTDPGDLSSAGRTQDVRFWLTLLHHSDGESQLIDAGSGIESFGGVARFATLVDNLEREAKRRPRAGGPPVELAGASLVPGGATGRPPRDLDNPGAAAVLVSSGDNFLAGPEFNLSIQKGPPHFDAIALDLIGYDAFALGNHEFDFGPEILADFIESFEFTMPPFLSANLDVSGEPRLQSLVGAGKIAASTIVKKRGEEIGIIGATTPNLPFISSPRNVVVIAAVAAEVMAEVARLEGMGIDKIDLISHLQGLEEDLFLAPMLDDVDIIVSGGGGELLANTGDLLVPGDVASAPYPAIAFDMDGTRVPIVSTAGDYKYVGRLIVGFDKRGEVVAIDGESGPVRVAGPGLSGGVTPDPVVQSQVVDPVEEGLVALASNVIAASEVPLNGARADIRSRETNEGNLVADALLWQADQLAPSFGVPVPDVALQNGGGIRNDNVIPAGAITELVTFDILPFPNFVAVLPNIPRDQFREILENAVSRAAPGDPGSGTGRFAQIAGFSFEWNPAGTAIVLDDAGNVITPGTRVRNVTLDDGTKIVENGVVVSGPGITVATIDFLANGGDQYPFRGASFTTLGVTYQQAFFNFLVDGLFGVITAAEYPIGGEGRIFELP